jgi:GH18 family chitinase
VGGIPKEVRDLSAKLQEQSKGTLAPEEALSRAARTLGYNYGGGVGPSWERAGLAGGPGRSAGVQYEAQQNYARLQQLRTQLDEARREVEKGGTLSPSRTANLATLRDAMAAELGYVNAGKSPNETELATAGKMLPEDLNAWNFTGANKAKLDRVIRIVDDKLSHAKTSMGNVGQGRGFEAPASEEENAAGAGATEK